MSVASEVDPFDVRLARRADGTLREFNDIGVLAAVDVHVAQRLTRLGEEAGEVVELAVALAVRAPRLGHVYVDLTTVRDTATVDSDEPIDLSGLPWPDAAEWVERVAASPLVAAGDDDSVDGRPLRLIGSRLYLDRYWREERAIARDLRSRSGHAAGGVEVDALRAGLGRMFGGDADSDQVLASASAVLRRFAVVAGGPGTGKTTTVARIAALLFEQGAATGSTPPVIGLAAPTGKAAARLAEAVHEEAGRMDVSGDVRERLLGLGASTLHRLLGWRPGSHSRFRHHAGNRLPHDVVIVDETSMVSLTLMARLVAAVRADARLILVGDPAQLTSIEAGAVLGDIVGPAASGPAMRASAREQLAAVSGVDVPGGGDAGAAIGDGIVVLEHLHRFGGEIATLARAVRHGDAGVALEVLRSARAEVQWIDADVASPEADEEMAPVREAATDAASAVIGAAAAGDAEGALRAVTAFRLLCAHRRGEYGVETWGARVEAWLGRAVDGFATHDRWFLGRPLLVTENDYSVGLYNGDTGVVVARPDGRPTAAFERKGEVVPLAPNRLGAVETVYAMTIHKSQGSQFDTAAVLLPPSTSQILTRELLYTAFTRARKRLIVVGSEQTVRAAVERSVARASGLRDRLWAPD